MANINLIQITDQSGTVIDLLSGILGLNYNSTYLDVDATATPDELTLKDGGIDFTKMNASTFGRGIISSGSDFELNLAPPLTFTGAQGALNFNAPLINNGGALGLDVDSSLSVTGGQLGLSLGEGLTTSVSGASLSWISDIAWTGAFPEPIIPMVTRTAASTYTYTGLDQDEIYKARLTSTSTEDHLNTLFSTSNLVRPAGGPDTIATYYDSTINRLWWDVKNASITATHLDINLDATGIGFDADKVDGCDVDDARSATTDLWSANQIISYVGALTGEPGCPAPVADKDTLTPPGAPAGGDRYLIAGVGVGGWVGKDDQIATWDAAGGAWVYTEESHGMLVFVQDEALWYTYDGANWVTLYSDLDHELLSNLNTSAYSHLTAVQLGALTSGGDAAAMHGHNILDGLDMSGAYAAGDILLYDGADFAATSFPLNVAGLLAGEFLRYDGADWVNVSMADYDLSDLGDVTLVGAAAGELLSYDGADWVNAAFSDYDLNDLGDVNTAGQAARDYLKYDGAAWVPVNDSWAMVGSDGYATLTAALAATESYIWVKESTVEPPGSVVVNHAVTIVSTPSTGAGVEIDCTAGADFTFNESLNIYGLALAGKSGTSTLTVASNTYLHNVQGDFSDGPSVLIDVAAGSTSVTAGTLIGIYTADNNSSILNVQATADYIKADNILSYCSGVYATPVPVYSRANHADISNVHVVTGSITTVSAFVFTGTNLDLSNITGGLEFSGACSGVIRDSVLSDYTDTSVTSDMTFENVTLNTGAPITMACTNAVYRGGFVADNTTASNTLYFTHTIFGGDLDLASDGGASQCNISGDFVISGGTRHRVESTIVIGTTSLTGGTHSKFIGGTLRGATSIAAGVTNFIFSGTEFLGNVVAAATATPGLFVGCDGSTVNITLNDPTLIDGSLFAATAGGTIGDVI